MGAWKALRKIRRRPTPHPPSCSAGSASREELQRENERLRRKVEELERKVAEQDKQISDAEKQISDAEKQISDAEKQIADLERQLAGRKKDSTNSSKPPSSDGPADPPPACRPGANPLPQQSEQVRTVGEVHRYQVSELPPLRAQIIEYQCHKVACPHCGQATRAELPAEVQTSLFGPRLAGLIAYLTVGLRIPRRGG